jgi:hypothetical protein
MANDGLGLSFRCEWFFVFYFVGIILDFVELGVGSEEG